MASELYGLLTETDYEYLYLLGDIIDTWRTRDRFYWSAEQRRLLMAIVEKSREGVDVKYVPGNHDDEVGDVIDPALDYLPTCDEYMHQTSDGRVFLVTHGDQFDKLVKHSPASAAAGAVWWDGVALLDRTVNKYRRARKLQRYNLSLGVRKLVSNIIGYENMFIERALNEARERTCDGVICGHTHQPALQEYDGILYANCGDWVVCGSAIVESYDGSLNLIYRNRRLKRFDQAKREQTRT